jgi:hypothetical protein
LGVTTGTGIGTVVTELPVILATIAVHRFLIHSGSGNNIHPTNNPEMKPAIKLNIEYSLIWYLYG